jgi:hypothetical protein
MKRIALIAIAGAALLVPASASAHWTLTPSTGLDFGKVTRGSSSTVQSLTFTRDSCADIEPADGLCDGALVQPALVPITIVASGDFHVVTGTCSTDPTPVPGGAPCRIDVSFAPTRNGRRRGELTVSSGMAVFGNSVSAPLTGIGQPPKCKKSKKKKAKKAKRCGGKRKAKGRR